MIKATTICVLLPSLLVASAVAGDTHEDRSKAMKSIYSVFQLYLADSKGACPTSMSAIEAAMPVAIQSVLPEYDPERVTRIRVSDQLEIEISGGLVYYYRPNNRFQHGDQPLVSLAAKGTGRTWVVYCSGEVKAIEVVDARLTPTAPARK